MAFKYIDIIVYAEQNRRAIETNTFKSPSPRAVTELLLFESVTVTFNDSNERKTLITDDNTCHHGILLRKYFYFVREGMVDLFLELYELFLSA